MSETTTAGNMVRALREKRGMSRQLVARLLDISERTVIRHEDGTTPIRRVHAVSYAELFEVPVETIMDRVAA